MKANRSGGNLLQQHYDKLALVLVLLLLTVSAVVLVMQVAARRQGQERGGDLSTSGGQKAVSLDVSNYNQRVEGLRNPISVPPGSQRLAVGELRVACVNDGKPIPYDALVCPFCGTTQPEGPGKGRDSDGDGIPDEDEIRMGLNFADPTDARLDPDGDRYSTFEEFKADPKTIHTNAASFPPPHTKLRLAGVKVDVFRIRFLSVQDSASGVLVFQLNLRTLAQTYFKKMGEDAEGWVLTGYEAQAAEGPTLVLKKGESVKRLVRGKVIQEDFKTATLISLLDLNTKIRVKKDDDFKLQGRAYKVVDIGEARVVIRDESTGSDVVVERPTEADRLFLQGAGGEAVAIPGAIPGGPAVHP